MKRMIAVICLLAVALTACGRAEPEAVRRAEGRYVEEELPLPEQLVGLWDIGCSAQGEFFLLGTTGQGELCLWLSSDGGAAWHRHPADWLDDIAAYDPGALALDEEGALWFAREPEDPALLELYEIEDWDAMWDALDSYIPPAPTLCRAGEDGIREQGLLLQNEAGDNAQSLFVARDHLAVSYGEVAVYQLKDGGKVLETGFAPNAQPGDFFLTERELVVTDGEAMRIFDLETGQLSGEVALQRETALRQKTNFFDFFSERTAIADTGVEGLYAYCNAGGIYRVSADGVLQERVIPGDLTSLIQPNVAVSRLFVRDDAYYVYVTDKESLPWKLSGAKLLRYRYDASAPTLPTRELRVYALRDAPTVRQTVGVFQRDNPDTRVRFEIALSDAAGATEDDALRTLSAQLLAGAGPDILILDDLPLSSYREKGALRDLSGLLSQECLEQIFQVLLDYDEGGALYTVPARFYLPMILGEEETVLSVDSLAQLAAQAAALESPQLGVLPADLFEQLLPLLAEGWMEGEVLDTQALAGDLQSLRTLAELYEGRERELLWNAEGDARVGAIGWIDGWTPFYLHNLGSVEHLTGPYTAAREGAVYRPFSPGGDPAVIPRTAVAIAAAGEQGELAARFVECMLSQEVQLQKLGDGLPANRQAAEAGWAAAPEGEEARFGVSFWDEFEGVEKGRTLPLVWPDRAFFDSVVAQVEAARLCTAPDGSLLSLIRREAEAYLEGRQSLEDTMRALEQKLALRLAEA